MRKTKVTLSSMTIVQFEGGEQNAVVDDNGTIYLPVMIVPVNATVGEKATSEPAKKAPKVVDDTADEKPVSKKRTAPAKAKASDEVEIPHEEWADLEEGEEIIAIINDPAFKGKKFTAVVKQWDDDEGLLVKFHEDGEEDHLLEGDKVFKFVIE